MQKMIKNILSVFLFTPFLGISQTINTGSVIIKNTLTTGDQINQADNLVQLAPNFKFTSTTTEGFVGKILGGNQDGGIDAFSTLAGGGQDIVPIDQSRTVGTIPGTSNVSSNGAYSYNIPIKVSPGTNSMEPKIYLQYSSLSKGGLPGVGWSIGGLSSITRKGKTIYNDGVSTGVALTNEDHFVYDGKILIPVIGNNGENLSVYATEEESFSEIISYGKASPTYFTVETREGYLIEFGNTPNSRLKLSGEYVSWMINKITDRDGNYMTYTYKKFGNRLFISEINYTGNTNTGLAPYNLVKFTYKERADKNTTYVKGNPILYYGLLDNIETYAEGSLVSTYTLKHSRPFYSYLTAIEYQSYTGDKFNNTIFSYGDGSPLFSNEIQNGDNLFLENPDSPPLPGNYSGDGRTEVVTASLISNIFTSIRTYYYNNTTGQFLLTSNQSPVFEYKMATTKGSGRKNASASPADVNGDGYSDLILTRKTNTGNYYVTFALNQKDNSFNLLNQQLLQTVQSNTGNGTIDIYTSGAELLIGSQKPRFLPADLNGDHKTEFIFYESGSSGNGTLSILKLNNGVIERQNISMSIANLYSSTSDKEYYNKLNIGDYNGDGNIDIYTIEGSSNLFGQALTLKVYSLDYNSQTGDYSLNLQVEVPNQIFSDDKYIGDFNGDGKSDLLVKGQNQIGNDNWTILYMTGDNSFVANEFPEPLIKKTVIVGTYPNTFIASESDISVGDFNGDGKDDVFNIFTYDRDTQDTPSFPFHPLHGKTYYKIYYSNGNSVFETYQSPTYNKNLEPASMLGGIDINGDSKEDMLFMSNNELHFFNRNKNGLMQANRNGLGFVEKIDYEYMTNNSIYTKLNDAVYPMIDLQFGIPLVKTQKASDGIGGENQTDYAYKGLKGHLEGKGIISLKEFTSHNLTTNIVSTSFYDIQSQYIVPFLERAESSLGGSLISKTEYLTTFSGITGNFRYIKLPVQVKSWDYVKGTFVQKVNQYSNILHPPATITTSLGGVETDIVSITYQFTSSARGTQNLMPMPLTSSTTKNRTGGGGSYIRDVNYTYDNKGHVVSGVTDPQKSQRIESNFVYDDFGNVVNANFQTIDGTPTSTKTEFTYDNKGRFVVKKSTGINETFIEEYKYEPKFGKIIYSKDPTGLESTATYDGFGRLVTATNPQGVTSTNSIEWNNDFDNVIYKTNNVTDGASKTTVFSDLFNRKVRSEEELLNRTIFASIKYDNKGNVVQTTSPIYDDETAVITTFSYDNYNRVTSKSNGANSVQYTYDVIGNNYKITQTHSPTGRVTYIINDASGKLIESNDYEGTLTYQYYSSGKLKKTLLDGQKVSEYTYDPYGNQATIFDPNSGTTHFKNNALGQVIKQTDNMGNSYNIIYDEFGRIFTSQGPDGVTVYTYVTSGNGLGQVKTITTNGSVTSFTYDNFNRMKTKSKTIGSESFVTSFEYDQYDNNTATTYPSNLRVENTYTQHVLTNVSTQTYGNIWTMEEINSKGLYTKYMLGNGIETEAGYDKYAYPTFLKSGTFQDMEYTINPATGNLESRVDNVKLLQEDFQYDLINRLTKSQVTINNNLITSNTSFTQPAPINISYSSNGNIDFKSDIGNYTYNNQKINAVETVTNGQGVVSTIQQDITYTPFKMIKTIEEGDYLNKFTYDASHSRIKMEEFNAGVLEKTKYYFGLYEKEVEGSLMREINYVPGGNGMAAVIVNENGTENIYYIYTDYQGTVTSLTDNSGNVVFEQNFDAWGRERDANTWEYGTTGSNTLMATWIRGYTGHEHLKQFKLINMNNRLYDPSIGRMLSPDIFVQAPTNTQSYNKYSYGFNNPLRYNDPTGNIANSTYSAPGNAVVAEMVGLGRSYYYIDGIIPISAELGSSFYSNFANSTGGIDIHTPYHTASVSSVGNITSITPYKGKVSKLNAVYNATGADAGHAYLLATIGEDLFSIPISKDIFDRLQSTYLNGGDALEELKAINSEFESQIITDKLGSMLVGAGAEQSSHWSGVYSVTLSASLVPIYGGTVASGVAIDFNNREIKTFNEFGFGYGIDASIDLSIKHYVPKDMMSPFGIDNLEGWGSEYTLAIGPISGHYGGDTWSHSFDPRNFSDHHSVYDTYGIGYGIGPNRVYGGFTRMNTVTTVKNKAVFKW